MIMKRRMVVLAFVAAVVVGAGAARAEDGTCKAKVTGDLAFDVSVTNPPTPAPPMSNGPVATAATDYWLTDKEMRQGLSAMIGAFDSVGATIQKKGAATPARKTSRTPPRPASRRRAPPTASGRSTRT